MLMAYRVADACDHAEHAAQPEIGAAIPPRVFRHRVRVASRQLGRFEPRSGCRHEPAIRRAGSVRVRAEVDFPACGAATATRHAVSHPKRGQPVSGNSRSRIVISRPSAISSNENRISFTR